MNSYAELIDAMIAKIKEYNEENDCTLMCTFILTPTGSIIIDNNEIVYNEVHS